MFFNFYFNLLATSDTVLTNPLIFFLSMFLPKLPLLYLILVFSLMYHQPSKSQGQLCIYRVEKQNLPLDGKIINPHYKRVCIQGRNNLWLFFVIYHNCLNLQNIYSKNFLLFKFKGIINIMSQHISYIQNECILLLLFFRDGTTAQWRKGILGPLNS